MDENHAETEHQDEAQSPAARLREFEDKVFGKKAGRIEGKIEKGHGSDHHGAPDDVKAHHAALEHAIEAEKGLVDAKAKLVDAEKAVAAAEARVTATHDAHLTAEKERQDEAA